MRLQQIINEEFNWDSDWDLDIYRSLKGLANKNEGVWKSKKQRDFLLKKIEQAGGKRDDLDFVRSNFGVEMTSDQYLVTPSGMTRWANYGSRSLVPVRHAFVVDRTGVVQHVKLGNKGNMRDGSSIDPSKNKVEFTRPAQVDAKHLEKTEDEKKAEFKTALGMSEGEYVGEPGGRMKFEELTLVAKKLIGTSTFGYNMAADKYWNLYTDANGNHIVHVGKEGPEKDGKVTGTATVKDHYVSKKGVKTTKLIRPRFKMIDVEESLMQEDEAREIDGGVYRSVAGRDYVHYVIMRLNRKEYIMQRVAKSNPERKFNAPFIIGRNRGDFVITHGTLVGEVPEKYHALLDNADSIRRVKN